MKRTYDTRIHGLLLIKLLIMIMNDNLSFLTCTSHIDCTISNFRNGPLFNSNFDTVGLEPTYLDGKQIIVPCKLGFAGLFKMKCSGGEWTTVFNGICEGKFIFVFMYLEYIFIMLQKGNIFKHSNYSALNPFKSSTFCNHSCLLWLYLLLFKMHLFQQNNAAILANLWMQTSC